MTDLLQPLYNLIQVLPFSAMKAHFMQRAVLELFLLAPICAIMGTLTVQFRMAFFSDAIAHSAFTGIALGLLIGISPWFALVFFGVMVGIATARLKRKTDMAMDTTLGVMFSTTVALGLAVISAKKGLGKSLPGFLYGDILSVTDQDILATFGLLCGISLFLFFYYNKLIFISLHEHLAKTSNIAVDAVETVFSGLLALVVAFSIRAVGILLVTALLVIPAAAAGNLARSMKSQVWLTFFFTFMACFIGLASSVAWDTATGAAIILWASGIFLLSLLFRNKF